MSFFEIVSWICHCKLKRVVFILVCLLFFTSWYLIQQTFDKIRSNEAPAYVTREGVSHETSSQDGTVKMDDTFKIRYKLLRNHESGHDALISITNTANFPLKGRKWTLYFCNIRLIRGTHEKVSLEHINGCLYKIQPASDATLIDSGETISFYHTGIYFIGARCHVMPNWYVIGPDNEIKLVRNTVGEDLSFVDDFNRKETWKRGPGDQYDPYTPSKRYDVIGFDTPKEMWKSPLLVIPQPLYIDKLEMTNRMAVGNGWTVHAEKGLEKEAELLKARFKIPVVSSIPPKKAQVISLKIGDPQVQMEGSNSTNDEAYLLSVNTADQTVQVIGRSASGVFYGIQTLLSLADKDSTVPMVTIKDAPRYNYRGMHLDVARNFMPKSAVLRLLDVMATYKLNKFHFHLTDDEGWRLEIPGLPELTEVGARRCHDLKEIKCIQPQLGALPIGQPAQYFSVQDYRDILQYANDRHIQVIPEFDMPGHGHAAVKSMEARHRKLKEAGDVASAKKYLLNELNDKTEYKSVQLFKDNAINPCLESTFAFISHVIENVMRMHSDIQPLTLYHFGGDEVARGVWERSRECDRLLSQQQTEDRRAEIKKHFIKRIAEITARLGLQLGGWEDGFFQNSQEAYERKSFKNKDLLAYSWNNIPFAGGGERAHILANAGYKVIMIQASHLYFDHPYEPDPEERGNHWATRFTDTRKVFGFMPDDVYANTEAGPCTIDEGRCLELKNKNNAIGMSAALWTETVRTADQMDFMIFPRLLSLAERAWHKASWEGIKNKNERNEQKELEWEKFSHFIVTHELPKLDRLGIKYRVPPPGASFEGHRIKVRTALPGLPVKYSQDGGKTWHDVTDQTHIDGEALLTTWSTDNRRKSKVVKVQSPLDKPAS